MKNTFEITVNFMDEDFTIELNDSTCSESDVLELVQEMKKERFENESGEDFETDLEEDFDVSNWGDVPQWAQDFDVLEELMPEFYNSVIGDIEIFESAKDCDIDFKNVDEAYSGEFDSDADFAQNMAEELGYMDDAKTWPFTCIDWDQASRDLMYDYSTANNHYFRNF
jgi:hypothetical protein